ncbi:LppX_LprAFG lipoprotein [uncultured Nocardioides sp.]|uniref:LppX_LprAFG lipoprotein n=1 Tax=uncultured Nocardioides sp. TaxID=198441 RepID=UPI0025FD0006|nr:LppX_LprAFG lipoprotein [uncultured Nocardioides sp.]
MRTSHRRRLAVAGAVLPIALVSLAACGSDEGGDSASDASSASASADTGESPAESSESPSAAAGEEVDPAEFVAEYKAAFEKSSTAHMTLQTDGDASFTAEGDIDYSTTPPTMAMTLSGAMAGEGLDMRLVDGIFYMSVPNGDGKFYSFDLEDPNNPLGSDFTKQLDPATAFDSFEDAITSVTLVGEEDVEGEQMRHYSVVVDSEKVTGPLAGGGAGGALPKELAYDVWLDGDGLFRKMESDLGPTGTLTMNIDDWGKEVSVEAPAKDQVTTMSGMPSMSPAG